MTGLSGQTCGEACWHAREDICRCSCGGANHGCLRDGDGERPVRTCRMDGYRRELVAVGTYVECDDIARPSNKAAGVSFLYAPTSSQTYHRGIPARMRMATKGQVERWPELAAYRGQQVRPYLVWILLEPVDASKPDVETSDADESSESFGGFFD